MSALEPQSEPNGNPIGRVRAAVQVFQHHEDGLTQQMCHITETGEELARFTIALENGVSAYIPVDANTEDKLRDKGLPCFQFPVRRNSDSQHISVGGNPDSRQTASTEYIEIPMQMTEAIELSIFDAGTVESIQAFPTVS